MGEAVHRLFRFLAELKRRRVYRVAAAYVVTVFVGLETVDLVIPSTTLPAWVDELFLALAVLGFPVAVVAAWIFDVTPEGLQQTGTSPPARAEPYSGDAVGDAPEPGRSSRASSTVTAAEPRTGRGTRGAEVGAGSPEADHSIVVLPFETLGGGDHGAFTDGMHAGVLTRLSEVADLDVISRTSAMRYRSAEKPLPEIGAELDVRWVLRGEVQEAGGQVLVNARLVDAPRDRQVWAEGYQRQLSAHNIFEIQAELARTIIDALQARITPGEARRVQREPTRDLEAYRLYVQGRESLDKRTEEGMRRALTFFERAVEQDERYALAWVGVADALGLLYSYRHDRTPDVLTRAEHAAERALALHPGSAEAHASLGLIRISRADGPGALRALERATELRPSYAEAHNWLSYLHCLLGHGERGLERARRAIELDPLSPEAVTNITLGYLMTGEPERALREARRAKELEPSYSTGPFFEAVALYRLGRYAEAASVLREIAVAWAGAGREATLVLVLAAAGEAEQARQVLDRIDAEPYRFAVGLGHVALGEVEAAFRHFEQVDAWNDWSTLAAHGLYPELLAPLREDPRYRTLLRKLDRYYGVEPERSHG